MKNNNFGNIIFASSFATNMPSFSHGIYAASKAMVLSLSKSFAAELAPHNIRVNSFSPGVIDTSMTKAVREKNKENMLNDISLKRFGKTEEIANVAVFLSSDESAFINASDIFVDGGGSGCTYGP